MAKRSEAGAQPEWATISASALKKAKRLHEEAARKAQKAQQMQQVDAQRLDAAKAVVIEQPSTPSLRIKIGQTIASREKGRVRLFGYVHRLRQQKALTFLTLRDGTGFLQCVLAGKLVRPRSYYQHSVRSGL